MLPSAKLRLSFVTVVRLSGVRPLCRQGKVQQWAGYHFTGASGATSSAVRRHLVPISGGGLISGVALAAKSINPAIRCRWTWSFSWRSYLEKEDHILSKRPVVRDLVDAVITVNDEEIINAMKLCYEILKVAVESSGAIGLAACLEGLQQHRSYTFWRKCRSRHAKGCLQKLAVQITLFVFSNLNLRAQKQRKCFYLDVNSVVRSWSLNL